MMYIVSGMGTVTDVCLSELLQIMTTAAILIVPGTVTVLKKVITTSASVMSVSRVLIVCWLSTNVAQTLVLVALA